MFGREDERVGEERIAEENRRVGAVRAVGRVGAVAFVSAVEDVVMHQRREVDQLHDSRAANERLGGGAAGAGAEGQERTKAFAGVGEDLAHHRADLRLEGGLLRPQERLQGGEVRF